MNKAIFTKIVTLSVIAAAIISLLVSSGRDNIAFAGPKGVNVEKPAAVESSEDRNDYDASSDPAPQESSDYQVQAVLTPKRTAVISGAMDGVLTKMPFENGDVFKKGDVLAAYNCRFEKAKGQEVQAQLKSLSREVEAYKRLKDNNAVADVDYIAVIQKFEKTKAILEQTKARIDLCVIKAPFDGRVTDKTANSNEAVRSGRVLMEISSTEPLQAELLVPSIWLRWLNIGTNLKISVYETGKTYGAKIIRIHGKIDPVTQTAYVVAEINQYKEELLPGMSGQAFFNDTPKNLSLGFLGLKINNDE